MVSPSGLAVDLEEGGFTQDGELTVRLLLAHLPTPLPAHNDTILIGGERYKIEEIIRKPGATRRACPRVKGIMVGHHGRCAACGDGFTICGFIHLLKLTMFTRGKEDPLLVLDDFDEQRQIMALAWMQSADQEAFPSVFTPLTRDRRSSQGWQA